MEQAEEADNAILKVNPRDPRSLTRHALRLSKRGQVEEALKLARNLSSVPDYGPSGALLQAQIYDGQKEPQKAGAVLAKALERSPRHPRLLTALAWNKQRAGDFTEAEKVISSLRALATNTKTRANVSMLEAEISLADGRIQAALARYRETYSLDPTNTIAMKKAADLAEKNGFTDRALEALTKLRIATPKDDVLEERINRLKQKENHRKLVGE